MRRTLRGRYGIAGEQYAVDLKMPFVLVRDGRGKFCEQVGVHIKPALDIVLRVCLAIVVFLFNIHHHYIASNI